MDVAVPFASHTYLAILIVLVFSRGMDFLSTWIATPNLALEGNPIAKKLGWTWGLVVNGVIVFLLACWPAPAVVVATASLLVAARNFQSAWLMRSLGETQYRKWHVDRIRGTRLRLFLFCLAGNTLLTAAVGAGLILASPPELLLPMAIGMGIIAYAIAVAFYTLLGVWNIRRATRRQDRILTALPGRRLPVETLVVEVCAPPPTPEP